MNNSCNLLTIKTKYLSENLIRTRNYYYSAKTAINPEWTNNYKGNNFDMIYKLTKSIPLKIIDDFGTFKITYEAIEIKRKKTENSIFKIDPKLRLEELVIKK